MRKLRWVLAGTVLGFVAAHFVNRTPEGRRFFDQVNRGLDEFGRAFATGYREEEAESASSTGEHEDVEAAPQLRDQR